MKNVILIAAAALIVWVAWQIIGHLLAGILGLFIQIALIGLFCYAVYMVYKALNRQKIT